jgi:pimeloyl-ACP methyl ester carboxylesterase
MADDAAGVLDALDVDRVHVVGFSAGGCIAQELALRHPDRVRSVVLSGTWARSDAYLRAMIGSWRWQIEHAPDERTFLEGWLVWVYTRAAHESGWVQGVVETMLADPHPASLEAIQRTMDACLRHDTLDRLHEIEVPALVIAGDADPQCPPPFAEAMAERLPDAEVQVWRGQSHQPFQEEAGAYNARLETFWRRVEG